MTIKDKKPSMVNKFSILGIVDQMKLSSPRPPDSLPVENICIKPYPSYRITPKKESVIIMDTEIEVINQQPPMIGALFCAPPSKIIVRPSIEFSTQNSLRVLEEDSQEEIKKEEIKKEEIKKEEIKKISSPLHRFRRDKKKISII
jgi:hypothetical protein